MSSASRIAGGKQTCVTLLCGPNVKFSWELDSALPQVPRRGQSHAVFGGSDFGRSKPTGHEQNKQVTGRCGGSSTRGSPAAKAPRGLQRLFRRSRGRQRPGRCGPVVALVTSALGRPPLRPPVSGQGEADRNCRAAAGSMPLAEWGGDANAGRSMRPSRWAIGDPVARTRPTRGATGMPPLLVGCPVVWASPAHAAEAGA